MRSSSGRKGAIVLRLMVVLLLAWTLSLGAPRQASACCGDGVIAGMMTEAAVGSETATMLVEWGKRAAAWIKEFAFLADIINGINAFTDTFKKEITTLGALINGGQQGLAELMMRLTQGMVNGMDEVAGAKVAAEIAGKNTPPTNDNQQLCNLVVAGSATGASMWTHQIIAKATGDMLAQRYRGRGADGNGPQYASDERNIRCGKGAGGFPTANPIDGYPAECVNKDPTLTDADIVYSKALSGLEVLQMPTLVPVPVTVFIGPPIITYVPKPVTRAEKLYVAALNFCAFAAGPRPSPPHGKDLESPEGIARTASFDHALAVESVFTTQCTKRVAYLTRPNCTDPVQSADPSIDKVCKATKLACKAFVAAGGTLTPDIDCDKGLSPRQEEWIKHMKCTTNQFYTSAAGAGVNHGMMMDFSTMCDLSNTTWQAKQADDEAALVAAMKGMQEMQGLYLDVGLTAHTDRINAPTEAPLPPRRRDEAALERPAKKVAAKTPHDAGLVRAMEGDFAADRISLPVTLAP